MVFYKKVCTFGTCVGHILLFADDKFATTVYKAPAGGDLPAKLYLQGHSYSHYCVGDLNGTSTSDAEQTNISAMENC